MSETSKKEAFVKELEQLINKHSRENESNTPDLIIASYIELSLFAFTTAVNMREAWYGRKKLDEIK